ncbi:hypothetical protein BST81_26390 [Leptolyngbya sp. 'hensonii']|uniref:hypothetical protein n=1 Tax=Leptolyngbya sp. 'hensonii' TaxID=1922337 RepID=UPI00094F6036|nr:hypothetical protein [Leptolyngbya sp. 'hensonii']OLP15435.1 hypothetical protein BST81_26390 [Leptolyngbya sp. 'hensonii']
MAQTTSILLIYGCKASLLYIFLMSVAITQRLPQTHLEGGMTVQFKASINLKDFHNSEGNRQGIATASQLASNLLHVSFFGAIGIALEPNGISYPIDPFLWALLSSECRGGLHGVSHNARDRARSKPEKIQKDSAYPPSAAYYTERFYLSAKSGALCRTILPIHPLRDLRQKLSVY